MTKKKTTKASAAPAAPAAKTAPFFRLMSLELLQPNDYNARRFAENNTPQRQARYWELVQSVREKGILEPLLVRLVPGDDVMFEVVAGERRYRAAKHVAEERGISAVEYMVPCMVHDLDDDEAFDIMIVENLHRDDLTPFETAGAFRAYLDKHGHTPDAIAELAARTGIPAHAIRRQVRILALPEPIRDAWRNGQLTQSHAEHLTRLDEAQALELLDACLRSKLTVRELAERIGALAVDLDKGFFDKAECQGCQSNTSVQSGLFADLTPAGKCSNAQCFEAKQGAFLVEHWESSKAAQLFGTRAFRFGHRLDVVAEQILKETAERCLACDAFASIVRTTGVVVSGYERTCLGPRACFEELYCAPAVAPVSDPSDVSDPSHTSDAAPMSDVNGCGRGREECPEDGSTCPDCLDPGSQSEDLVRAKNDLPTFSDLANHLADIRDNKTPATPPPPSEETGPVFNAERGRKFRELHIKAVLPDIVSAAPADSPNALRLVLTALAQSSTSAKTHVAAAHGFKVVTPPDQMARKLFEIPAEDLAAEVVGAALAHVLNDFTLTSDIRRMVAEHFGVDIARDWRITRDYLQALTKSEIVRVGEEVGLWKEEKVEDYRQCHHKGKALLSLGKEELIDCYFLSEVDLAGKVPAEIVGKK